jgi:hypothetical protein
MKYAAVLPYLWLSWTDEIRRFSKNMQKTQNRFGEELNPLTFAPPYETGSEKEEKTSGRNGYNSLKIALRKKEKERGKSEKRFGELNETLTFAPPYEMREVK